MFRIRFRSRLLGLLVFFCISCLVAGCGGSPEVTDEGQGIGNSGMLGQEGGTVTIDAPRDPADGAKVIVPANLLDESTEVVLQRIEMPEDVPEDIRAAALGPVVRVNIDTPEEKGRIGLLLPYNAPTVESKSAGKDGLNPVVVRLEDGQYTVIVDVLALYDQYLAEAGDELPETMRPLLTRDEVPENFVYAEVESGATCAVVDGSKIDTENNKGWIPYHQAGPKYPTFIIVHGWNSCADADWVGKMAKAILTLLQNDPEDVDVLVDDANIAFWDWRADARSPLWYPWGAYGHCRVQGEVLYQDLTKRMGSEIGEDPSRIHLIGHSYGGYVSAACGSQFFAKNKACVGQLTGLDIPKKLLGKKVVTVDDQAFEVITLYPIPGEVPIASLGYEDVEMTEPPNVMSELVRDSTHGNIHNWYMNNKIVWGKWNSLVAVKPFALGILKPTEPDTLDISYALECRGVDHWDQVSDDQGVVNRVPVLGEAVSRIDSEHIEEAVVLNDVTPEAVVSSGLAEKATASVGWGFTPAQGALAYALHVFLKQEYPSIDGCYASSSGTASYSGKFIADRFVKGDYECQQPCFFVVYYNSVYAGEPVEQSLRWDGKEISFCPSASGDRSLSVLSMGLGQELTATAHVEKKLDGRARHIGDAYWLAIASCSAAALRPLVISEEQLGRIESLLPLVNNPNLISLQSAFTAGTNLFVAPYQPDSSPGAFPICIEASSVWGPPLSFELAAPELSLWPSGLELLHCVPKSPGLYVFRNTFISTDDNTKGSYNVPVFIAGNLN